jgi:predicted site-specific integrase-resolvase
VAKEKGSGLNDSRRVLTSVLKDPSWSVLVVEHKDRLTRFGANYIITLLEEQGRRVEVINTATDETTDLVNDLVSVIYSFSARLYGKRRSERAQAAIAALGAEDVAVTDE